MHLSGEQVCGQAGNDFQFPLLGIFPCTAIDFKNKEKYRIKLSIPSTWDFSMHQIEEEESE